MLSDGPAIQVSDLKCGDDILAEVNMDSAFNEDVNLYNTVYFLDDPEALNSERLTAHRQSNLQLTNDDWDYHSTTISADIQISDIFSSLDFSPPLRVLLGEED